MNNGAIMDITEYVKKCASCDTYFDEVEKNKGICNECGAEFSPSQRRYALENPDLYSKSIDLGNDNVKYIIQMADGLVDGKILAVYGVFAVTTRGIECLSHSYQIDKSQLNETDWIDHMSEKTWVNINDFKKALHHSKNS